VAENAKRTNTGKDIDSKRYKKGRIWAGWSREPMLNLLSAKEPRLYLSLKKKESQDQWLSEVNSKEARLQGKEK